MRLPLRYFLLLPSRTCSSSPSLTSASHDLLAEVERRSSARTTLANSGSVPPPPGALLSYMSACLSSSPSVNATPSSSHESVAPAGVPSSMLS